MTEDAEQIVLCYACRTPMNVATVGPYSRVICPHCETQNRVKNWFGSYKVTRRHAIGGMSSVFIANDETLGREVAVKILSEEYSKDEVRIAAFKEEARLTASFSHPHVVRIYTSGWAYGWFFIAMEYVPGGHLEQRIEELGKIPESEMLPLAIQIAEGLKGAQMAGLIHRDIKPGNILLDAEGNAKIVDFGLALVTSGGKAQAKEIWATPYYVPPEAIDGNVEDFRADIYAFGATLYHALGGEPPCNEDSMSGSLLKAAKQKVMPLKKVVPELTEETSALVSRAMAYDPMDRFSSYDEMIAALKRALAVSQGDLPSEISGTLEAERRKRLSRRKQEKLVLAWVGAFLAIAVVVALVSISKEKKKSMPYGTSVVSVDRGSGGGGDSSQEEISRRYLSGRAAMKNSDFTSADALFKELLGNPSVQEPTRTWAGIEAVVAAFMNGRAREGKQYAKVVQKHILENSEALDSGFSKAILPVLRRLHDMSYLPYDVVSAVEDGDQKSMACFLAGLKNWEQGVFDKALPFFHEVVEKKPEGNDVVMGWYRGVAKRYLDDFTVLSSSVMNAEPKTMDECRRVISELVELERRLKTKGRSRFNIQSRITDMEMMERQLSKGGGQLISNEANRIRHE